MRSESDARRARKRHEAVRELVRKLKDGPCTDCGGRFHFAAMDFDHRPGTEKNSSVADMMSSSSLERIRAEVAKCDLVCANCHRVRTYDRIVAGETSPGEGTCSTQLALEVIT